ncbi:DUF4288 domain-containing protein [Bacillus sp. 18-5]|uniref:DUF4288 domain-containing protein n=1 Tax=Bacillus sp. 18-5 TaxID=3458701 RepID=UPI004045AFC8
MYDIYSVKVLFESTTSPRLGPEKIFEERIFLIKTKKPDEIESIIHENFPEETYENSEGGMTTNKVVAILDTFELVDNLEESVHLKEVYSRYLVFDKETSPEEAIERYSLDK